VTCNTWHCQGYLPGRGFWYWEICPKVNTTFTYTVGSLNGQNIDMFLYEAGFNMDSYRKDVSRYSTPRNWGYSFVSAQLNQENGYGSVPLQGGQCYYFVVDWTEVGVATQQQWTPLPFAYLLTGNPESVVGSWGPGAPASASTAAISGFLLALLCIVSSVASS